MMASASSLSARFDNLPDPLYSQMPIKLNGAVPKRAKKRNHNNMINDEAIIVASEPQIIRPNVSNFVMKKKTKKANQQHRNNNMNRNRLNNGYNNNNNNNNNRNNVNNRGRGFKNNFNNNGYNNNNQQQQQQSRQRHQRQQQQKQLSGYKSYRTSSNGFRNGVNGAQYGPYKRPIQSN